MGQSQQSLLAPPSGRGCLLCPVPPRGCARLPSRLPSRPKGMLALNVPWGVRGAVRGPRVHLLSRLQRPCRSVTSQLWRAKPYTHGPAGENPFPCRFQSPEAAPRLTSSFDFQTSAPPSRSLTLNPHLFRGPWVIGPRRALTPSRDPRSNHSPKPHFSRRAEPQAAGVSAWPLLGGVAFPLSALNSTLLSGVRLPPQSPSSQGAEAVPLDARGIQKTEL